MELIWKEDKPKNNTKYTELCHWRQRKWWRIEVTTVAVTTARDFSLISYTILFRYNSQFKSLADCGRGVYHHQSAYGRAHTHAKQIISIFELILYGNCTNFIRKNYWKNWPDSILFRHNVFRIDHLAIIDKQCMHYAFFTRQRMIRSVLRIFGGIEIIHSVYAWGELWTRNRGSYIVIILC